MDELSNMSFLSDFKLTNHVTNYTHKLNTVKYIYYKIKRYYKYLPILKSWNR